VHIQTVALDHTDWPVVVGSILVLHLLQRGRNEWASHGGVEQVLRIDFQGEGGRHECTSQTWCDVGQGLNTSQDPLTIAFFSFLTCTGVEGGGGGRGRGVRRVVGVVREALVKE
jgi:hypothetical protein